MFIPFKVNGDFHSRIVSLYTANSNMNAGSLVDINPSDTVAVGANASVGFTSMRAGSLVLASVGTSNVFPKEFGIAIPAVDGTGPSFEERILELASSYMTIPVGYAVACFKPFAGDINATDQYVGALASDSGATGLLDTTNTANYGCALGIFQGRWRKAQGSDVIRGRYLGNSTANSTTVALVEYA
jgi:hypothetical protein